MTLQDLLETLRQDILRDTADVVDGDDPRLWSDRSLCRYIDEAQRRLAKRAMMLRSIETITTVPFQRNYDLDAGVFAVVSARFLGNGEYVEGTYQLTPEAAAMNPVPQLIYPDRGDLGRAGHAQFDSYISPETRYYNVNNISSVPPSKPMAYDTDEFIDATNGVSGTMSMRLYPIPDMQHGECTIEIRAVRMPYARLTSQNTKVEPEVPEDYHLHLLEYAAYLALRVVDNDAGDPQRAQEFLATFEKRVEEARRDTLRKMFTPQVWAFGRNGFGYEGN